ncbi:hypothetical protein K2Q00_03495 [Patescibacteria group bacterium]|nr:hypothetical protein [Patescibacteria group bacterium]
MTKKNLSQKAKLSLEEKAKKDKEFGGGVGRGNKLERTRGIFRTWLLVPRNFLGANEQIFRALGFIDAETIELYSIKSQAEFAEKFGVAEPTLSRWKGEIEKAGNDLADFRQEMKHLSINLMGALYRKGLSTGDPAAIKLWLQVMEGWNERTVHQVDVSGYQLSEEEKAELDQLMEANL